MNIEQLAHELVERSLSVAIHLSAVTGDWVVHLYDPSEPQVGVILQGDTLPTVLRDAFDEMDEMVDDDDAPPEVSGPN